MEISIEYLDPILLKPHPKNPKKHTDKQVDRIAKSMENTGGSVVPIVVDEDNMILAGHGRWMAHKRRGDTTCPVVRRVGLTKQQKNKFVLSDNAISDMTGYHDELLAEILQGLDAQSVDISDIGFSEKELDRLLNFEAEEAERDRFEEASSQAQEGAFELRESLQLTKYDCLPPLDLPPLLEDRIPAIGEIEFKVWMGQHRTSPLGPGEMHYHLFGRESTKGLDPRQTLISFYIDDVRFERVWGKLRENTQRFLNADTYALTMPDFTTLMAWPLPRNLWNMYRSFYAARYWQEAGLQVVPNVVCYDEASMAAFCEAVPKHVPTLSKQIQTTGKRTLRSGDGASKGLDPDVMRETMATVLDELKPESLIVYGGESGLTLGREICKRHGVRFVGVLNRATVAADALSDGGF